jgi:hypothetical protein
MFGPLGDLLHPGQDLRSVPQLPGGRLRHPSATPFPRTSLRGVTLAGLRRLRPRTWREISTRKSEGFVWVDENGVERLRFMRPTGANPATNQWSRQANGYFRWQSAQSVPPEAADAGRIFLDSGGNPVSRYAPDFEATTHIIYEGPYP